MRQVRTLGLTMGPGKTIKALARWSTDAFFPLWIDRAWDSFGGFHEAFDLDGTPIVGTDRRTRVQARQIYTFARAPAPADHRMGPPPPRLLK